MLQEIKVASLEIKGKKIELTLVFSGRVVM